MAKTIKAQADELREKVELLEGPDEGTVIRFEYTFDKKGATEDGRKVKRHYYTYVALWVADRWYVSGNLAGIIKGDMTNLAIMQILASEAVRRAEVAVVFEPFKS